MARQAFEASADKLNLYPDGKANALRGAVAARFGLEPDRLIFGCGSDEVFTLLAQFLTLVLLAQMVRTIVSDR